MKHLLNRLAFYNLTAIKPNFPGLDPAAKPDLNSGTWSPWIYPNGTMINGITLVPAKTTVPTATTTRKTTTTQTTTATAFRITTTSTTTTTTEDPSATASGNMLSSAEIITTRAPEVTTGQRTVSLKDKLAKKTQDDMEKNANRINKLPKDLRNKKGLFITNFLGKVRGMWKQARKAMHAMFN